MSAQEVERVAEVATEELWPWEENTDIHPAVLSAHLNAAEDDMWLTDMENDAAERGFGLTTPSDVERIVAGIPKRMRQPARDGLVDAFEPQEPDAGGPPGAP